ncbi:hypothetical protein C8R43DRAFT_1058272 [Mycena crocata]|nr:hypothetical protein C8R43DRAFT_1058272 [Mycena crocata]
MPPRRGKGKATPAAPAVPVTRKRPAESTSKSAPAAKKARQQTAPAAEVIELSSDEGSSDGAVVEDFSDDSNDGDGSSEEEDVYSDQDDVEYAEPDLPQEVRNTFTTAKPAKTASKSSSSLAGKFDLYAMELPFLSSVYLPAGASQHNFAALYKTILTYQAKPDSTAQCVLPAGDTAGRLSSAALEDPMEGLPWDIALTDLTHVDALKFSAKERKPFVTPPREGIPGVKAQTGLAHDHCGVQSASGVFRMQHAWTGSAGEEVFEGYMSFNVVHSAMYKRKRHGSGLKVDFAFWAVRARRDAHGKEIGLEGN